MNSEQEGILRGQFAVRDQAVKDKQALEESKTIVQGQSAESFMQHPAWKLVVRDLTEIRSKLLTKLLKGELNKAQMDGLRSEINSIDSFVTSPIGYIVRLRALAFRKSTRRK